MVHVNVFIYDISAERLWDIEKPIPPVKVSTNLNVIGINERLKGILEAPFVFTINYMPAVAQISVKGRAHIKGTKDELKKIHFFESETDLTQVIPFPRSGCSLPLAVNIIGILMFIDIDDSVCSEIDRIRTGRVASIVFFRVKYLCGKSLPASSRTPVKKTRPAFAKTSKFSLYIGDEFIGYGISVRSQIG